MLVISRKPGEKLFIGDDIVVTVLEVNGNRVRLGIDAPADVPLLRSELHPSATVEEGRDLRLAPMA
jgi:carbon storage regulator